MKSYVVAASGFVAAVLFAVSSHAGVNAFSATGPNGGWANAVYYIPGQAGVALASNGDGLFRTTDNGVTWTRVFSGILNAYQRLIVSDPRNANHIVFQAEQRGIQISDDGGLTFKSIGAYPPTGLNNAWSLSYSANGLVVYAAFGNKVLRSLDGGTTWAPTLADLPAGTFLFNADLAVAPNDQDTVYASVSGTPSRVYKTTNGGQSWTTLISSGAFQKIVIDPNAPNVLLGAAFGGIYRSFDSGVSWNSVSGESSALIQFDPVDPTRAFAVTQYGKVLRSDNRGVTWTILTDLKTWTPMSLSFDTTKSGRILYGCADGILLSEDAGVTWASRDGSLYGGTFSLAIHRPSKSVFAMGNPSPVGLHSRDGAGNWISLGLASMKSIVQTPQSIIGIRAFAVASDDARVLYAARDYSLMKSIDGGLNWTRPTTMLDTDAVLWLAIDPTTPSTMYASSDPRGMLRSLDSGVTWAPYGSGMLSNTTRFVMVDPKNSSTLYATTIEPNVYKSTNAGLNWNVVTIPANNSSFYNLAFDPTDATTIYAATSDGVWRSDNAAGTWVKIANTLANVSQVAVDPDLPNVVLLNGSATANGIQRSLDKGATWENIPSPSSAAFQGVLAFDPKNPANILYSLGYNGIYQLEIAPDLELKSSSVVVANSTPQTLTMQLTNKGPYGATNLKLSADAPVAAQTVSVQTDKGTCTLTLLHIDCTLATLKNAEVATITVSLTTASTASPLTASVTARESDPVAANNSLSNTPVPPPPPPAPAPSGGGGASGWELLMALLVLMGGVSARHTRRI